jgi:hypothetical protein
MDDHVTDACLFREHHHRLGLGLTQISTVHAGEVMIRLTSVVYLYSTSSRRIATPANGVWKICDSFNPALW